MSRVLLSAGEPSGDMVGAALLREMRRLGFEGTAEAIGGIRLRDAGARIVEDASSLSSLGVIQSAGVYLRSIPLFRRWLFNLKSNPPELFVPIDFGYANVRLARQAKRSGSKVLYFMPPGSWNRKRQGADLAEIADVVATPFEWSADMLQRMGANAVWVGHPVVQLASKIPEGERKLIALLPGSRRFEVVGNTRLIGNVLRGMPLHDYQPVIVAAPNIPDELIRKAWPKDVALPKIFREGTLSALKQARAALVCSGTATLEAAVCNVPMIVIYHVPSLLAIEGHLVKRGIRFISMPNVLLDREVVPEAILKKEMPNSIREQLQTLIADTEERRTQLDAFEEIRKALGPADAITRTARLALELLNG